MMARSVTVHLRFIPTILKCGVTERCADALAGSTSWLAQCRKGSPRTARARPGRRGPTRLCRTSKTSGEPPLITSRRPHACMQKATSPFSGAVASANIFGRSMTSQANQSQAFNRPLPRFLSNSLLAATKRYQIPALTNHSCAVVVSFLHTQARPLIVFLLFPRLRR